jgi:hypothetical protein
MSNFENITDIPRTSITFRQGGILTKDGSVSMTEQIEGGNGTKASEVNIASREFFSRMKASRRAPNFSFANIDFHDTVAHIIPMQAIADIDDNDDFDPTSHGTGGTFYGAGLEQAKIIGDQYLAADANIPSSLVVLLLGDGECSQPERSIQIADTLKADPRIIIAAAYFATKGTTNTAGPNLLRQICSDPARYYKTVYDAETLRRFFEASMTAAAAGA